MREKQNPRFSKVIGLSVKHHEQLCIAYLQRLEKEMEVINQQWKKAATNQKVVSSTSKGKRDLISTVNYDRRKCVGSVVETVVGP